MKELPYFKNYVDEYLTGDIRLCSYEAQGVFAILKCLCWKKGGYLSGDIDELSRLSGVEKNTLTNVMPVLSKYDIICYNKQNLLYIKFILEQLGEMTEISEKRGKAGKIGMRKRWQLQAVKPDFPVDNKCYNSVITNGITKHNNIDQDQDQDKDIKNPLTPCLKNFNPIQQEPSPAEVVEQAANIGIIYSLDDAKDFIENYKAKGWVLPSGVITNWTCRLRSYKSNGERFKQDKPQEFASYAEIHPDRIKQKKAHRNVQDPITEEERKKLLNEIKRKI